MTRKIMWALSALACFVPAALAVETLRIAGKVDAVTVYRGQAVVTRLVELAGPAGLREVVVTDLPEHVVPGSIHAESADGVDVRSVRYRVRPVLQDVRESVRQLDEQIRQVEDELKAKERQALTITGQKAYLAKLEQFVAPTATTELSKGVLNAKTLIELSGFVYEQRKKHMQEELELQLQQRDLKERLELLHRERNELTSSSSKTAREAVVFVNLRNAEGSKLRLRYLVERANWSPSYNVRTGDDRQDLIVEYNASIQQMSGEDWTDVNMTLSTATPSLVAKGPMLQPLNIALASITPQKGKQVVLDRKGGAYRERRGKLIEKMNVANQARNSYFVQGPAAKQQAKDGGGQRENVFDIITGGGGALNFRADIELNQLAADFQNLDLVSRGKVRRDKIKDVPKIDEVVTVTYKLTARTSLPSRSDRQLIQIASLPMKGEFYKVATPVLTAHVYEEVEVANQSDMVLLAGPVTTYLAGQFVGHGVISTVAIGESFTVGLGIDSSLKTTRELVEKDEVVQGGNRLVDFTYRLALENFGGDQVTVRLLARLPKTKNSDIKVTMVSPGKELSEDPTYRHDRHKKGILRWEVEVPGHAIGPQAQSVEYEFRLEYDKQMTITGIPLARAG